MLPMRWRVQYWWPIGKVLLALVIMTAVGWRFAVVLRRPELWQQPIPLRIDWLTATALSYVVALGFCAAFWYWLLVAVGERPYVPATVRAYYIGHLGKYVPGKAWGLLLRTGMLVPSGIRPAVGAMTTTFETLTTMASGALVAAVLFALLSLDTSAAWWSLGLLALAGLPIVPAVFNPLMKILAGLAGRAARRFGAAKDPLPLPSVTYRTLVGGLALTSLSWGVLGFGLWAVQQAILPEPLPWSLALWGRCSAYVALAWVAGFLSLPTPGGIGVRELILEQLLTPEIRQTAAADEAQFLTVLAVLVLRLLWTAAELMMVGVVYWLPARAR
jgi:glycosyltransferase 2 family protein